MATTPEELDGGAIDASVAETLSAADKRILSMIQSGFPLEPRPYAVIGKELGLTEAEVLAKVRALRGRGVIRRIGANFQSAKLGFKSTLCSAHVPEDKLEEFIAEVNSHTGVTHNYLRGHHYNVWFACIAPSTDHLRTLLDGITAKTGIAVNNLPATRLYKIKVDFAL